MSGPRKKRGARYRFEASMLAGVAVVLGLAYAGHVHARHHPGAMPIPVGGAVLAAVGFGLVMFVLWSVIAMFRRAGRRTRERERPAASPAGRRERRRYARQG